MVVDAINKEREGEVLEWGAKVASLQCAAPFALVNYGTVAQWVVCVLDCHVRLVIFIYNYTVTY